MGYSLHLSIPENVIPTARVSNPTSTNNAAIVPLADGCGWGLVFWEYSLGWWFDQAANNIM